MWCLMLFCLMIMLFMLQENTEIKAREVWKDLTVPQPVIIVRGTLRQPKDAFLASDKMVLCKISIVHTPLALMAAFYVFNMHYTPGCSNFFSIMETYFLGYTTPKKTRLANFLAQLKSVT